MAPTICFKAKAVEFANIDGSGQHQRVKAPTLTRRHCDMAAFRTDPRYSAYANSDFFAGMLERIRKTLTAGTSGYLRLDALPANVRADTSGFLTAITIEV